MNSGLGSFPRGLGDLLLWLVPIGAGFEWWGTEADLPRGYLLQDGTVYQIAKYPKLGRRLGNRHGGDGITTFGVPDRRGRIAVGKDNMGGTPANRVTSGVSGVDGATLGAVGGDQNAQAHSHNPGSLTTDAQGNHSHNVSLNFDSGIPATFNDLTSATATAINASAQGALANVGITDAQGNHAHNVTGATAGSGAGGSQNMPPSIVCNHIIRAG